MSLLAIDPGLEGGYAWWKPCGGPIPKLTGIVSPEASPWQVRATRVWTSYRDLIGELFYRSAELCVACEYPKFFSGSEQSSASAKRGDLFKLIYVVGGIAEICSSMGVTFVQVPVNDWKGQMSKVQVTERIKRKLGPGCPEYKSHVWDAVGIGMYIRGEF